MFSDVKSLLFRLKIQGAGEGGSGGLEGARIPAHSSSFAVNLFGPRSVPHL